MTVLLCCDDQKSGDTITKQLADICSVTVLLFYNISDFLAKINDCPDAVMMIALRGASSTEIAMSAREHNPRGKLLWFSDLDFALISFRIKATYFGLLPIEDEKLKTALEYCEI